MLISHKYIFILLIAVHFLSFTAVFFLVTIYKSKFVHITSAMKIIPSNASCYDCSEYVPNFYCALGLLTSAI